MFKKIICTPDKTKGEEPKIVVLETKRSCRPPNCRCLSIKKLEQTWRRKKWLQIEDDEIPGAKIRIAFPKDAKDAADRVKKLVDKICEMDTPLEELLKGFYD